jgi:hypothetical protein
MSYAKLLAEPPKGRPLSTEDFKEGGCFGPLPVPLPGSYYQALYAPKERSKSTQTEAWPVSSVATETSTPDTLMSMLPGLKAIRSHLSSAVASIDSLIVSLEKTSTNNMPSISPSLTRNVLTDQDCELPINRNSDANDRNGQNDAGAQTPVPLQKDCETPFLTRMQHFSISPASTSGVSEGTGSISPKRTIVGCGTVHPRVRSALTPGELFVSNVHASVSVADLVRLLEPKINVLGLAEISHPESASKSFLLTVAPKDQHRVLSGHFWPPGIHCKPFVRPKSGRLACMT